MFKKANAIGFIILFISAIFIFEPLSAATDSSVLMSVTTGKRRISNNNLLQAEQNAVSDALDTAVQNAFAKLVSKQILASNLAFYYNQVLANASDYIITYQVFGGIENKGHYLVAVESKVDMLKLEKTLTDARIINANKEKPVILFFIAEKTASDLLPRYWWGKNPIPYQSLSEKIIVDKMTQDRFIVTGSDGVRPDPGFYNITFNSIYDVAAATDLGRKMSADLIVIGKADSAEAINRMGQDKAFDAQISLDCYNVQTQEKVFTSQVQAVVKSDIESEGNIQALIKAASLSAQDLSDRLNEYWTRNLRKENAFDVTIKGGDFLPRFLALKQEFKQMPGIENMQPKEMGSDYAVMEIFYKGSASQFADAVMLKTFDSFGLEFSDVTQTHVTITFIEK